MSASSDCSLYRRHLQKACVAWARQKKLNSTLVHSLISHARDVDTHAAVPEEFNSVSLINESITTPVFLQGAWLILSCISPYCSDIDAEFVLDSYRRVSSRQTRGSSLECQIVSIMGNIASQLTRETVETLETELSHRLMQMETDPDLVSSIITCLTKFNEQLSNLSGNKHQHLLHWAIPVLKSCGEYIRKVAMGEGRNDDDNTLVCHLYTVGELAQRCPELLDDDMCVMVQSLIVGQPDGLGAETRVGLSVRSRAHAFITLGKLCLQKKELAKQSVLLLVRELEENDDPVVRNNVIVVMRDLCVR